MHRRALEARENVLGREHPNTLTSVGNIPLAEENTAKVTDTGERVRMLTSKHLFISFQCPSVTRRKRCIDGRWKHERMCLDVSILTRSPVSVTLALRMLPSKHLFISFQCPSVYRFRHVIFPLAGEN
jgi:hypothetical protein